MEGHGKRVLIADDEECVRRLIAVILERAGYNVYSVADGIEALSEMKRRRFDAVIADCGMPRLDGVRLLLLSRMMWPQIPVLLLSAELMELPELVREQGLCALIPKPFDPQDLLRTLQDTLSYMPEQSLRRPNGGRFIKNEMPVPR